MQPNKPAASRQSVLPLPEQYISPVSGLVIRPHGGLSEAREPVEDKRPKYFPDSPEMEMEVQRQLAEIRGPLNGKNRESDRTLARVRENWLKDNGKVKLCWSGPTYSHGPHEWDEDKPGGQTFWCPGASTDRT